MIFDIYIEFYNYYKKATFYCRVPKHIFLHFTDLFGNPLAQDYDYRNYVIHNIKSLQRLDRRGNCYILLNYVRVYFPQQLIFFAIEICLQKF